MHLNEINGRPSEFTCCGLNKGGSCAIVMSIGQLNVSGEKVVPTWVIGLNHQHEIACLKGEVREGVPLDTLGY